MAKTEGFDGKPRDYPAWRGPSVCTAWHELSVYAAWREPSIYTAWRLPKSPAFIPLGAGPEIIPLDALPDPESCTEKSLPPLAGEGGRRPEGGNKKTRIYPLGGCPRTQHLSRLAQAQVLSRLAAAREPSVYPAWQLATSPVFTPLGGSPRAQHLPRLAAAREPSVCPAWRLPASPVFTPPGARPSPNIARINPFPRLRGKVAEGRKGGIKTRIYPLGAAREPSIYPAWRGPRDYPA